MTHFASSLTRLTAAVGHLMLSLSTTVNGLAANCDVPWNQLCGSMRVEFFFAGRPGAEKHIF